MSPAPKLVVSLVLTALLCPGAASSQARLEPTAPALPAAEVLTLDEALRRLDTQSPELAQLRARSEEAEGLARQALAALLPVLVATGSYTRNSDEATIEFSRFLDTLEQGLNQIAPITFDRSGLPADRVIQPRNALSVNATLRVPLFAANAYSDLRAAREAVHATNATIESARQRTRSALLQALWLGSTAEAFVEVARRGVGSSQEYVKSAERALASGTTVPLAVLRARTELARREKELAEALSRLEQLRLSTGVLLGQATPVQVRMPALEIPAVSEEDEALVAEALRERPELASQAALERAAEHSIDSAWWRLAPTLSATGSVFASDAPLLTGEYQGWRASLELTWTAYDGGFRYGKLRQARGTRARVQAERRSLELQIAREVRDALREFRLGQERLKLSEQQLAVARDAARTAQNSFEKGAASYTEVLDTLDRLYLAEASEQEARARMANAIIALGTARGKPW